MLGQPGATAYIGCIGKDHYGKVLRSEAESDGHETFPFPPHSCMLRVERAGVCCRAAWRCTT